MAKKILIVEDDGLIANRLMETLTKDGYEASIVDNGDHAVSEVKQNMGHYSLILMDIHIKGNMDGVETVEKIRENSLIPVIYLTAQSDNAMIERAGKTGSYGYLVKPFRHRELIATIEMALYKYGLEVKNREMEARIQYIRKRESLGVMAGAVAHHFNNLFMIVMGNAELISDDAEPGSLIRENAKTIIEAVERGAELTKELLKYTGRFSGEQDSISINSQIRETLNILKISIPRNIETRFNHDDKINLIEFESVNIRQIIIELVLNATEAVLERDSKAVQNFLGSIIISSGLIKTDKPVHSDDIPDRILAPGSYVFIEVADNGCGMNKETREKIFDPFFTTKFVGRGLGLAAVSGIVKNYKGAIQVNSDQGEGTRVRVLLPEIQNTPGAGNIKKA